MVGKEATNQNGCGYPLNVNYPSPQASVENPHRPLSATTFLSSIAHHYLQDPLKTISLQDSNASALLQMNRLNYGTCHRKILMLVILSMVASPFVVLVSS